MKTTILETIKSLALCIGAAVAVGSIAPAAKSLPIETSNSPIFKQDYTGTVGIDANIDRTKTKNRAFEGNDPDVVTLNGERVKVRPSDNVVVESATGRPARRFVHGSPVFSQLVNGHYRDITVAPDKVTRNATGGIDNIDATGAVVRGLTAGLAGTCRPGTLVGQNCQTKSKYSDITGYGQGAVRTGGNTAILGGYDSNGNTAYAAAAVKLDNLALTAGGDRFGLTGSAAYSIGALSPFIAYQRGLTNYGIDYRMSDNFSLNAAYRSDNSYQVGARIDVGGNLNRPVAPVATCESGYRSYTDAGSPTCVKLIPAPVRPALPEPSTNIIRGRG